MAEAAVQGPASSSPKYYCHKCLTSVDLSPDLPDLTCPKCESGFVEELTQDLQVERTDRRTPQMLLHGNDMSSVISRLLFNPQDEDDDSDEDIDSDDEDHEIPHVERHTSHHHLLDSRRTPMFSSAEARTLPRFIEHLLRGLTGSTASSRPDGSMPFLASIFHGDPGDYAWGADGLDNAITQLLNQWESTGTPPASKEAIASLQSVTITQAQIDEEMQCSVCMEAYCLNDTVNITPCQHFFHPDCIIPWLQLHNSCPICRQSVDGSTVNDAVDTRLPDSSDTSDDEVNLQESASSTGVTDLSSESRSTRVEVNDDVMMMDIHNIPSFNSSVIHGNNIDMSWLKPELSSTSNSSDDYDDDSD